MTVMLVVIGLVVIIEVLLLWMFGADFSGLWKWKKDWKEEDKEQWRDKI